MHLREASIFLKVSTTQDPMSGPGAVAWAEHFASIGLDGWQQAIDLSQPGPRPRPWAQVRDAWAALPEAVRPGIHHQRARWRLQGSDPAAWLEWNASAHPYTGDWATQVELRAPLASLDRPGGVDAWVELARHLTAVWQPLALHVHPTDDHTANNIVHRPLLERGLGMAPDAVPDDAPGREVSRGALRWCACWITLVSPAMWERADRTPETTPLPGRVIPGNHGVLLRLWDDPCAAGTPEAWEAQRALRDALGWEAVAARDRWTQGYWQRPR
jgi:hypothetical protein